MDSIDSIGCTCANGGVCLSAPTDEIQICECPMGFVGPRCADIFIKFAQDPKEEDFQIIIIVSLTLCAFAITSLLFFFSWRRISSIRRRRREMKQHRNRRQSRVTIEGSSHPGFYGLGKDVRSCHSNSYESVLITQNEIQETKKDSHSESLIPVKIVVHM